jgi:UDP-glucose 4-epimerase
MKRKDILVTGGAGYIGSHTIVELYNSVYRPIVVDNLSNTLIKNIKGAEKIINDDITFYKFDCTNYEEMDNLFYEQKNIQAVIHFAAYKSVEESVRKPKKYFDNNIGSTKTLLELMNKHCINNIIFSSSCTVYGSPDFLPVNEQSTFKKAESPYGETKQLCEKLINESKINSISLRYFNPVGSHESSLIGDCSADKPNNLVPIICEVASGLRYSMQINGNDYNTNDGTCVRDYIHVVDLARAHVMALNHAKIKTAYNVGAGKGKSVQEVIDSFEKINNLKISYEIGPRREGDVEKIFSDNSKINHELNWFTTMSFESALQTSWKWEKLKNSNYKDQHKNKISNNEN